MAEQFVLPNGWRMLGIVRRPGWAGSASWNWSHWAIGFEAYPRYAGGSWFFSAFAGPLAIAVGATERSV